MKLLVGGGEGVTPRLRSELERFWDAPLCMTYASTETATVLGFECAARGGYHVNEFDFVVEVDRPDADGYGEIVVTTVNRAVMPLLRYRTGDVARWVPGRCACGLPFRRLSAIRARVDEQVSCAWGNVHPEFFAPILGDVPGYVVSPSPRASPPSPRAGSPSPRATPTSPEAPTARGEGRGEGQPRTPTPAIASAPHPSPLPASGERGSAEAA